MKMMTTEPLPAVLVGTARWATDGDHRGKATGRDNHCMDNAVSSWYSHYVWIAYAQAIRRPRLVGRYSCRHNTHRLIITTAGHASIRWTSPGLDVTFQTSPGDVSFFPCDHARHVMTITSADGYRGSVLCMPDHHLRWLAEDRTSSRPQAAPLPRFRDTLIRACLGRLVTGIEGGLVAEDIGSEIAARQLIRRLCTLIRAQEPDWPRGTSAFSPDEMRQIVARLDAAIGRDVSLTTHGASVGLSPSHFARKFRQSTGLSLERFMNRRRIRAAVMLLQDGSISLTKLSLDLGFSSQSHFTRVFSGLTGMTPKGFRRQHERTAW
jgi:AraC-like DNA-binding protein